ncbi:hypothetical protein [Escherichia coli]
MIFTKIIRGFISAAQLPKIMTRLSALFVNSSAIIVLSGSSR